MVLKNPGTMEIINKEPIILLDGAHNSKSFKLLFESLKKDFDYNKLFFIIGVLKDKNIKSIIPIILSQSDYIITTQSNNERALNSIELKNIITNQKINVNVTSRNNIQDEIQVGVSFCHR